MCPVKICHLCVGSVKTLKLRSLRGFLLRHAFPDFGSIGSNNEIQSNFAGSQTAIFKLLVSVWIVEACGISRTKKIKAAWPMELARARGEKPAEMRALRGLLRITDASRKTGHRFGGLRQSVQEPGRGRTRHPRDHG